MPIFATTYNFMDAQKILHFLTDVAVNNNRPWFQEHKPEYEESKAEFESGVSELIAELSKFDVSIANLTPKDCCYRFYRDIRFSKDKSPYKRHFGAYISAHGKKGLHGGYYLHMQPGHSMVAVGCYWLPTNILTSMRNEIMGNIYEWRRCVEDKKFIKLFGKPNETEWSDELPTSDYGFGISCLKTAPKDFPKDYEFLNYLKMKDYCAWRCIDDDFFTKTDWAKNAAKIFKVAKPMMDFVNSVVDDYE